MNKFVESFLEWLFPPKCFICGKILDEAHDFACPACKETLKPVGRHVCEICGAPVGVRGICYHCDGNFSFESNLSIFEYNETMREIMHHIKYRKQAAKCVSLSAYAVGLAEDRVKHYGWCDMIIPVPLHKNRMRKRGFNQAEIIGSAIEKITGVKMETDICLRHVDTAPQSLTHYDGRAKNVEGIFTVREHADIKDKNILLTDDIFTSGATLNSLAHTLKAGGAKSVACFTICISAK